MLGVTTDKDGNVYGTGHCTSIVTTAGAYQRNNSGRSDIMVFKLNPDMTQLIWATYIGGSALDCGGSIKVNDAGEVFVSGYTASTNFPSTNPQDRTYFSARSTNIFALKLSADGSRIIYSRILGRSGPVTSARQTASKGSNICLVNSNEVVVYSETSGAYSTTANALQRTRVGGSDLVITKLDAAGNTVYSSYLGGSGNETAGNICSAGNSFYLSGSTSSNNLPLQRGKTVDTGDCFLIKLENDSVLSPRSCFVYGSGGVDQALSVSYDSILDKVLTCGVFGGNDVVSAKPLVAGVQRGGFVARIDSSLSTFDYISLIGAGAVPTSIVAWKNGSAYIAGYASGIIPTSPNAFQRNSRSSLDGMLLSLDYYGSALRYGTYIGGGADDYAIANVVFVEKSKCSFRVLFGITAHSTDFPIVGNSYQPNKANGSDDQPALIMFDVNLNPLPITFTTEQLPELLAGSDASFGINAKTAKPITTDLQFEVVCNADMFSPDSAHPFRRVGDKLYVAVKLGRCDLTETSTEVFRLKGRMLLGQPSTSELYIDKVSVNSSTCLNPASDTTHLAINACFLEGRYIFMEEPLSVNVFPNPTSDGISLNVTSGELSEITVTLFDNLSRQVRSWRLAHTPPETEAGLHLNDIESGVYTLVLQSPTQCQSSAVRVIR